MRQGKIFRFQTSYGKVNAFSSFIDGHEYTTYLFKGYTSMIDGAPNSEEAAEFAAFVNYDKVSL